MNQDRVFSMLGIATKAGKVVSGEFSTEKAVKSNHAQVVIVAEDASDNTKKMFTNMCTFYHVPMQIFGTKETLGKAIGKQTRASLAVVDEGLAGAVLKHFVKE